jgi:uncharacterized membrane protein
MEAAIAKAVEALGFVFNVTNVTIAWVPNRRRALGDVLQASVGVVLLFLLACLHVCMYIARLLVPNRLPLLPSGWCFNVSLRVVCIRGPP